MGDLDSEEVLACPHCDEARLSVRSGSIGGEHATHDADYYCKACCRPVDEPAQRPRRSHTALSALGEQLLAADPDDVPGVGDP